SSGLASGPAFVLSTSLGHSASAMLPLLHVSSACRSQRGMLSSITDSRRRKRHMSEQREEDTVRYVIENNIAWVYFNRPDKRNCLSPKLNRQMMRVLTELEFRDDVGVLVLSGEGTAWSAGMDLKEYF